jgi:biopolymer transport protein ExbB
MDLIEALNRFTELGAAWVLWLLVVLSVVSVAVMVERAIVFHRRRGGAEELARLVAERLGRNEVDELREHLARSRSLEAAVLRAGLGRCGDGPAAAEEAMLAAQVAERQQLERNLAFLGTVGANAPFIGLAGTVIGIMEAFRELSTTVQSGAMAAGNTENTMAAIAEALVATLIGLLVAVPAVVAFNYFQRRIRKRMSDAQIVVHTLLGHLKARPAPSADAAAGSKG